MAHKFSEEEKQKYTELAGFFNKSLRTPVFRRPDEVGLKYEDVYFPSLDGVSLEGWFIPAKSNKVVICNHFMPGNRYGYPGHIDPYKDFGGFEVNLLPQYKALHDAGYNVLTYDMRNHGLSDDGNGRTIGVGQFEYRDVLGSIKYINSRPDTENMEKALVSLCLGFNSTIVAHSKHPEYFKDIKAIVGLQPISIQYFVERAAERDNLPVDETVKLFDEKYHAINGFHLPDVSPLDYAKGVTVPTKVLQVKRDFLTNVEDVQRIYDNISSKEKELYWIEDEDHRFQGYNYLGKNPPAMLDFLKKYI